MCFYSFYLISQIIIVHEVAHALGIIHEHQRADRDASVSVMPNNIMRGYESYFASFKSNVVDTMQLQYDYASVMHYYGTVSFVVKHHFCR